MAKIATIPDNKQELAIFLKIQALAPFFRDLSTYLSTPNSPLLRVLTPQHIQFLKSLIGSGDVEFLNTLKAKKTTLVKEAQSIDAAIQDILPPNLRNVQYFSIALRTVGADPLFSLTYNSTLDEWYYCILPRTAMNVYTRCLAGRDIKTNWQFDHISARTMADTKRREGRRLGNLIPYQRLPLDYAAHNTVPRSAAEVTDHDIYHERVSATADAELQPYLDRIDLTLTQSMGKTLTRTTWTLLESEYPMLVTIPNASLLVKLAYIFELILFPNPCTHYFEYWLLIADMIISDFWTQFRISAQETQDPAFSLLNKQYSGVHAFIQELSGQANALQKIAIMLCLSTGSASDVACFLKQEWLDPNGPRIDIIVKRDHQPAKNDVSLYLTVDSTECDLREIISLAQEDSEKSPALKALLKKYKTEELNLALRRAVSEINLTDIKIFLLYGALCNDAGKASRNTALHVAANAVRGMENPSSAVDSICFMLICLLRAGADRTLKNKEGETPLKLLQKERFQCPTRCLRLFEGQPVSARNDSSCVASSPSHAAPWQPHLSV